MLKNEVAPAVATQLLEDYREGSSFFWASPERTLLARGVHARLISDGESNNLVNLPERVAKLLAHTKKSGHELSVIVGAIPYDHTKPSELIVPLTAEWAGPLNLNSEIKMNSPLITDYEVQAVPEASEYAKGVNKVLMRLAQGDVQKVVLSRSIHITLPTVVDTHGLLRNLAQNNTHGYTFGMSLLKEGVDDSLNRGSSVNKDHHTLVGASPELLVKKAGTQIIANPLAGSAARSEDPIEDERRAVALLASSKDRHEHAVVVAAVAAALRPYCTTLVVPDEPSLVQTNTMWHLSTEIVGELADIRTSVLELAVALHPTPAVCGTPTDLAREVIKEIEPFERGFFTGLVGWCDSNGDGEWAVTIRCAEVAGRTLRLFAGAGIVSGSSGEAELAETSAKLQTLFLAMGLKQQEDEMGE
ncbi:isochorismate synthase DhbC [Paenibacillus glacialis]|uniref:isochorismate synthase n=1 Tax=Paenibacillus glacialis TaxID=494026 RepID=A0A162M4T8_9BACL|nr:isochorismate synthase DhbC [Paenibacillus glacialis]OAB38403.1 isochorismate synthase [Paenibacillus glacialis]